MTVSEAWCRTYTKLLPPDVAERRLSEITSHVHEAREQGVPRSRLTIEASLGVPSDLLWSASVRRRAGLAPLWLVPLIDASVGAMLGGVLIVLTFLWSAVTPGDDPGPIARIAAFAALLLVSSGHAVAIARRLRR